MTIKNYIVVAEGGGSIKGACEVDEARLYQWLKNGSIEDGDVVYEVVNKRIVEQPDMILVEAEE